MSSNLDSYRRKRDFSATPEPSGASEAEDERTPRFVVQEHHARRLHWDLRLERDGALASWAVPKGIPPDPRRNNLAVRTEDHPLEYLDFHGEIPAGHYGAGTMKIYDRGTYDTHKWRDDEVMVTFHGERVRGKYVLFRTDGTNWMIHRMDPPEDPDRKPLPERIAPMLARTGKLPKDDENWAYEIKWDGVRAIAYLDGSSLRLEARSGRDITARYPELRPFARALAGHEAIVDGEVVAFADGRPSFQKLQGRMHLTSEHQVRRLSQSDPVNYVVFDLLWLDGHPLTGFTYVERRERLLELDLQGERWQTPAHHVGDGAAMLEASRAQGLEGIIAKRLDCPYTPGRRSPGWVKVKNVLETDVVVGGWLPGEGRRASQFGALVVGVHEDGKLQYAGRVGTGFDERELSRLGTMLADLARDASPFEGRQPPRGTRFVAPVLVARVGYGEVTQAGTLRHPRYLGLRDDIDPRTVEPEGT